MLNRIRNQIGTAGLIVAVVALVVALSGGAYAATNATDSGKRNHKKAKKNKKKKSKGVSVKQVRKIAKQEAKKFANSNPGPVGPVGLPGAPGPKGDKGDKGDDGDNGSNGTNGTSAVATPYTGAECEGASGESGIEVTSAGAPQYVCNGAEGTFDPNGFTQTGFYGVVDSAYVEGPIDLGPGSMAEGESANLPISFPISLEAEPGFVFVPGEKTVVGGAYGSDEAEGCPGVVGGVPQAEEGTLCVYGFAARYGGFANFESAAVTALNPSTEGGDEGVSQSGAILELNCAGLGGCYARGLWAVTG